MKKFKSNKIVILTKEEATMLQKPKYNAYQCGYGYHGKNKYDRNKQKRIPFD